MFPAPFSKVFRRTIAQAQSFLCTLQCPKASPSLNFSKCLTTSTPGQQAQSSLQTRPFHVTLESRTLTKTFGALTLHQSHIFPCVQPHVVQVRHYQAALKPRLICGGCYFVWRHGRKHVECSDHPRHKQMKKIARRKVWQEDYTKGRVRHAMELFRKRPREMRRTVDRDIIKFNWLEGKLGHTL